MAGIIDTLKRVVGLDEEEYEYEYEYDGEEETTSSKSKKDSNTTNENFSTGTQDNRYTTSNYEKESRYGGNVVDLHPNISSQFKALIYEPKSYEDIAKIVGELKNNKLLIVNMSMLETEEKTNLFHCISGAIYSLNGSMQKVATDVFVLAPTTVDVDTSLFSEYKGSKNSFPWEK